MIETIAEKVWTAAYNADRMPRKGAWVAELTRPLNLKGWPAGMWVIIGRERPARRKIEASGRNELK